MVPILCMSGGWGQLEYAYITTYSINDFSQTDWETMTRSHLHADFFADNMRERASAKGVTIRHAVDAAKYRFKDSEVTEEKLKKNTSNSSEFVFYAGHGIWSSTDPYTNGKRGLGPATYDGKWLEPNEKQYGTSYNRWVIYDACMALSRPLTDFWAAFQGLHAMLGYHSNYKYGWKTRSGVTNTSEEKWDEFSNRWINHGMTIWEAYKYSVSKHIYEDLGYNEKIKIVYVGGTADGKTFNGADERFNDVYNDRAIGSARRYIGWRTKTYGVPSYD